MNTVCETSEYKIPSLRPHPTQQCNVHQYIPLLLLLLLLLLFSPNSFFQMLIQVQAVQTLKRAIAASIQHRTLNFNWPRRFWSPSSFIIVFGGVEGGEGEFMRS